MRDPFAGSDFSQNSQRLRAGRPAPTEPEVGSFPDGSTSDHESVKETGTTTIGISTTDGVVIATDMRASLGGRFVSNKTVQKVEQIHPTAALTLVGSVGGAQSFIRGNFARGGPFLAINPILGGVDEEGSHVYSIDPAGGVMEDDYTVTGSGLTVAYGTLEDRYEEDMSVDEARDAAVTAIKAAAERDTGSGNGVYIAEVTGDGVEIEGHENFEGV
ncbi:proteasome subunit beta [Halobacteriales archaeon QH_6_68_27]|nr:MAG: proteasome subunit beta [Halobacteriales archaeon QH_6_68_27]